MRLARPGSSGAVAPMTAMAERKQPGVRRNLISLMLVVGVGVAVRLNIIGIPVNRDEGSFAYIGAMLRQGGVIYRDAVDHKPPGVWFLYWLFSYIIDFHDFHAVDLHLLLLVYNLVALLLVVALGRRLASIGAGLWAGLVYAVLSSAWQVEGYSASSEMLMLPFIVGSLWLCVHGAESKSWHAIGAAGVLGACCFWTKQPSAVMGGCLAIYLFVRSYRESGVATPIGRRARVAMRSVLVLLVGFLIPSGILCGVFLATGRWSAFAYWAFQHNFDYASSAASHPFLGQLWERVSGTVLCNPGAWGFALAGCAMLLRRRSLLGWLVSGFLLASLAAACHSVFMYRHYMAFVVPSVSIAAGLGIAAVMGTFPARPWLRSVAAVVIVGVVAVLPLLIERGYYLTNSPAESNRFLYNINPFTESPRIADYIAQRTRPEEPVLILGSEPQILVQANRPSATRHLFMYPVVGPFKRATQLQRELMDDIARAQPNYVVLVNLRSSWLADQERSVGFRAQIRRWLTGSFVPEITVDRQSLPPRLLDVRDAPAAVREVAVNQAKLVVWRRVGSPVAGARAP